MARGWCVVQVRARDKKKVKLYGAGGCRPLCRHRVIHGNTRCVIRCGVRCAIHSELAERHQRRRAALWLVVALPFAAEGCGTAGRTQYSKEMFDELDRNGRGSLDREFGGCLGSEGEALLLQRCSLCSAAAKSSSTACISASNPIRRHRL